MSEFALIDTIRALTTLARGDVGLGIGDDAALLELPPGQQLVACTDTLVEGVHFLRGTAPADLGWKALAVNLSDLAAMGATPAWALLALTLPAAGRDFVQGFAEGYAALARQHGVALVGGDTTQGSLTITLTTLGGVPAGTALTRSGARVGDVVCVTGTLGGAAGALRCLQARAEAPAPLLQRLHRPVPRIEAGLALRARASACIDVSDGLVADLGHICAASGVAAQLDADALPLAPELTSLFDAESCRELALAGGDDYELCFTVAPERVAASLAALADAGCVATPIGRIVDGAGVSVHDHAGHGLAIAHAGWEHFAP